MTQFWIAALALGLVAAAIILVPVIRAWARQQGEDRSSTALGVGIVVALAIPVVSMMLYARWSTWDWATGGMTMGADSGGEGMHEMDQALAALEQRLVAQPEDLDSWMLLGRTYMSMRRFDQAARAYRRAAALDGSSPQVLADYGEALALSDPEGLQGEAGVIFERVLAMSPAHPKGLWYGGLNAYENANWALAEQRLGMLLTLNPPETLVPLIEERLSAARAHGAGMPPQGPAAASPAESGGEAVARTEAVAPAPEPSPPEPAAPEPAAPEVAAPVAASDAILLDVSLDPVLVAGVPGHTPVFIIARNPGGGPPLAVVRATAAELPMSVRLTDANAMMEGVTILDQSELELVARVSLSGSPAQRPGDLYGAVNYVRGNSGSTRLRIDRVAE
jgi:cytochrome c-type biogenesis protein CcmH